MSGGGDKNTSQFYGGTDEQLFYINLIFKCV